MFKSLAYGVGSVLLLCLQAHGQASPSLPREEAVKQIINALAEDPIRRPFNLEYIVGEEPPRLEIVLQKIYAKLNDPDSHSDLDAYQMWGSYYLDLRTLWNKGFVDHFSVVLDKKAVVATLKDSVKNQCVFTTAPTGFRPGGTTPICNLTLAQKQLDKIAGISSVYDSALGREVKIADFFEAFALTDIGRALNWTTSTPHPAQAYFLLYDDGWRLVRMSD